MQIFKFEKKILLKNGIICLFYTIPMLVLFFLLILICKNNSDVNLIIPESFDNYDIIMLISLLGITSFIFIYNIYCFFNQYNYDKNTKISVSDNFNISYCNSNALIIERNFNLSDIKEIHQVLGPRNMIHLPLIKLVLNSSNVPIVITTFNSFYNYIENKRGYFSSKWICDSTMWMSVD